MQLKINAELKNFNQDSLNVKELLSLENVQMPEMVSVQLNDEFLKQEDYETTALKDGDEINFLYFMGGGE